MKNPETVERAYSMASFPAEGREIMLNVRIATPPWDRAKNGWMDVNPGICSSFVFSRKLGDKVLGKEIGLGSQFTIGEYYFITTDKDIAWVAPLEPRSFFKWLQNQDGATCYIYVSATNPNDVRLVKEVDGKPIKIKYTKTKFFFV